MRNDIVLEKQREAVCRDERQKHGKQKIDTPPSEGEVPHEEHHRQGRYPHEAQKIMYRVDVGREHVRN